MQRENYDSLFKYIIIGNTSCGKTCLLHHFLEGKFKQNSSYTIGVEFGSKQIQIGNKSIKLQIWDTAGQERFKSVARTYYRGALGAVIVFDITSIDSFQSVPQWIKDARELARSDISIIVCANKSDLQENRVVQTQEIERMCEEQNVQFMETSALKGHNVEQAFMSITKQIIDQVEKGIIDQSELKPKLLDGRKLQKQDKKNNQNQQSGGCMGCGGGGSQE